MRDRVASSRLVRVDPSRFDVAGAGDRDGSVFGLPYAAEACSVVLVPVPWEVTTSYGRRTARGPAAIRKASPQLDLYDPELAELGLGEPWRFGIHMLAPDPEIVAWHAAVDEGARSILDAGDAAARDPRLLAELERVNAACRALDERVRAHVETWQQAGKLVGVVGGDHAVAFGSIAAAAARHPGLGILHVDAHADLRVAYEGFERSHASVMHNVLAELPGVRKLVQVGVRDLSASEAEHIGRDARIACFYDHALHRELDRGASWQALCDAIVAELPDVVYVSFDIDGLDPTLCPGTGTPVPGGLAFRPAMTLLLRVLASGRRIVGFDLVEVAPQRDDDEWDGNVGARLLYRLCGLLLHSEGARDDRVDKRGSLG